MFTFFYYLLALIIYIIAIPYLIFKSFSSKYKDAIPAKFFFKNNLKFKKNNIWFHACSMGEVNAIKPIIEKYNKEDINLSVITNTGFEHGLNMKVNVRYLPFEIFLPFWMTPQKVLLVVEAELWYILFLVASKQGTKTILINARINDKSYKTYKRFSFFYKYIFKNIDKIFAQSKIDKTRLVELGAKNVEVIGNIKLTTLPKITKKLIKPNDIVITAGSTHKEEEELILNSWNKNQGKLIIVPRHPERFDEVFELIRTFCNNKNITFSRYSKLTNFNSDIILIDKMGELNNIYAISDIVILGGSFIHSAGGHNPIEPAFFKCKLISGKTIFNQKSLFECVIDYKLVDAYELPKVLHNSNKLKKTSLVQSGNIEPIINEINNTKG
ncbi:Lipid IVA 3-deoxy-D-manno-octulosonic acid transferase [often with also] [hydrothermal vent metagenome]|uniref:Lipid IVA 3-deoxy-D-manno-octulosonic acid transferase [often with also] n=1 Tax=hydrothermal vent metagenome TaxID=652676 RepID=A0A3B1DX58_9ZZZZ